MGEVGGEVDGEGAVKGGWRGDGRECPHPLLPRRGQRTTGVLLDGVDNARRVCCSTDKQILGKVLEQTATGDRTICTILVASFPFF